MADQNRTIHKHLVSHRSPTDIEMPGGALILLAGVDPGTGTPAIWVEVNPDREMVTRRFYVAATGQTIPGPDGVLHDSHIGSFIDGRFVWHIYESRAHA